MTAMPISGGVAQNVTDADLVRAARVTGLFYLVFFVTGIVGQLVVRGQMFAAGDAETTLTNLLGMPWLARIGVVLELSISLAQALTAVAFYRLFKSVNSLAAGALAAYGIVNAVVILGSAGVLATAVDAASNATVAGVGGPAATVQLLYLVSGHLWGVGALFFGLWLLPMGWLVIRSGWMPKAIGWSLVVGGIGYALSAYVTYLFPGADLAGQLLTVPSIVGEVWIAGFLVTVGVRHRRGPAPSREVHPDGRSVAP